MIDFNSLIVSDYDGVIKNKDNLDELVENIELLKAFIGFRVGVMVSTGRLFESMFKEITDFEIPLNFLSCANGNVLFDDCFKLLWKTEVSSQIVQELKPYYNRILSIEAKDEYGITTSKKAVEYFIQIEENIQTRREIINLLLCSSLFDYCTEDASKFKIHIFNFSNKVRTIEIIRKLINLSRDNIYTIGDGPNDIEMIKMYNGFVLGGSIKDYETFALQKYESFKPFIKDVQFGLAKKRWWKKC